MRWIANIILVIVMLGSLLIVYELGNITSRVVSSLPTGACGNAFYENIWDGIFKVKYIDLNPQGQLGNNVNGNCVDFDLYSVLGTSTEPVVYFIQHNSTREKEYLAGVYVVNDADDLWSINNTYSARNVFFEKLPGFKTRPVSLSGSLASAKIAVGWNFTQNIDNGYWVTNINDYFLYNEEETNKVGNAFITRNVSMSVYKNIDAILFEYDEESIIPSSQFVGIIKNIEAEEDKIAERVFVLGDYFSNNVDVNYEISSDKINMTIDNLGKVNLSFEQDFSGKITDVSVYTLYKNIFLASSNNFTVNVNSTGDAPGLVNNYPTEIIWDKNFDETLNMNDFFYDSDGDELEYKVIGNKLIEANIDGNKIELTPFFDFVGNETIRINATDPDGLSVGTDDIELVVEDVSDGTYSTATTVPSIGGPQIVSKSPSSSSVSVNSGSSSVFLVSAIGDNTLSYNWTVNGVDQNNPSGSFALAGVSDGSYTVTVKVSDGLQTNSASWNVVVGASSNIPSSQPSSTTGSGADTPGAISEPVRPRPNTEQEVLIDEPNFLWLYIIIGIVSVMVICVSVFFIFRHSRKGSSKPKKEKKPDYEIIKSDEELRTEKFGITGESDPVVNFIKDYRAKGFSDTIIRRALVNKGWQNDQVDNAFLRA